MFKFLRNLFRVNKEESTIKHKNGKEIIEENGMTIEIDRDKGSMIITSRRALSREEIEDMFSKYVIGE